MASQTPTDTDPSPSAAPPGPAPSKSDEMAAAIAERLHDLGAETPTSRNVKRIVPWVISFAVHLGMVLLVVVIAGTVLLMQAEDEPVLIVADFDAMSYEPVVRMDLEQSDTTERVVQDKVPTETFENEVNEQLTEIEIDPISLISDAASQSPLASFAPEASEGAVEFVGLSTTNARRIVYVIDASGSMIRSLQIVLQELTRSIDALSEQQSFAIVFFQRNEAVVVPPRNRLSPATRENKVRALEWIDENVVPSGRSNPIEALTYALDLNPDVIFLLSENITGSGQFEVDQRDLLALLDQLNPADASGRRGTLINTIQFLDPDPLDTLRMIAEQHGGLKGYKFLDRAELGLSQQ